METNGKKKKQKMLHATRPLPAAAAPTMGSSSSASEPEAEKRKRSLQSTDADPFATTGSAADDMDDIFGGLSVAKQAKRAREAQAARDAAEAAKAEAKRAKAHARREMTVDPMNARVHRFDQPSGLNVYKAHHLGLGRGGDTPLCPFDCSCCF
jgi:hypothetical protein